MSLIEQLGGYDRAKHEFNMIKEMQPLYPDEIDTNERLLLEYRRQHNIFEEGDWVVPKKEYRIGDRVGTVENMLAGGVWVVFDSSSKMLTPIYTIEHATDEEIKAGRRL